MSVESPRRDEPMIAMYAGEIRVESGKWGSDLEANPELEIGLLLIKLAKNMPDYGEDEGGSIDNGKSH